MDKTSAEVFLFGANGKFRGGAPALVGLARGDGSAPRVGERALADILPQERTTPAGRFVAGFGPASGGKKALWVDYATAISLHPVINTNRAERRPERLRSPNPSDHRITYGCINVPRAFFDKMVQPAFAKSNGVVYILPEATPLAQIFPALETASAISADVSRTDRPSGDQGEDALKDAVR